ncbi:MAG: hypothetical protein KME26_27215 [Oscillatoria princeps RMCB-10]|nr:hypothetical protein [Oscillatoria princeps RMCB-10]
MGVKAPAAKFWVLKRVIPFVQYPDKSRAGVGFGPTASKASTHNSTAQAKPVVGGWRRFAQVLKSG